MVGLTGSILTYFHSNSLGLILTLWMSVLSTINLSSQHLPNYPIYSITEKDGLPSNEVYKVVEDLHGFIWFATDNGLSKFNGQRHQIFNVSHGLPTDAVYQIFEQQDSSIVGVCSSGEFFRIKNDSVALLIHSDTSRKYLPPETFPFAFYEDEQSLYHIGTRKGYFCFDQQSKLVRRDIEAHEKHLRLNYWLGPKNEAFCYRVSSIKGFSTDTLILEENGVKQVYGKDVKGLMNSNYSSSNDQYMVVPMIRSLFVKNITSSRVFQAPLKIECLGTELIGNQLFVNADHEGVYCYNLAGDSLEFKYRLLEELSTSSVLRSSDGVYWFSTLEDGVKYLNPQQSEVEYYAVENENITSFLVHRDYIAVGYESGLVDIPNRFRASPSHFKIYQISAYNEKILLNSTLPFLLDFQSGLKPLIEDKTLSNEIQPRKLIVFNDSIAVLNGISDVRVWNTVTNTVKIVSNELRKTWNYDLAVFGDTCIASCFGEIRYFNPLNISVVQSIPTPLKFIHFFEHEGRIMGLSENLKLCKIEHDSLQVFKLPDIQGVTSALAALYHKGTLHISTNKGVYSWGMNENGQVNELLGFEPLFLVKNMQVFSDTLYCATKKTIFKKALEDLNISVPTPYVVSISVNDSLLPFNNEYSFSHNENVLEFHLNNLFTDQPFLNYRYQLVGHDIKYYYTSEYLINYSSLKPGKYSFKVSATTNGYNYSNEIVVGINIREPFWNTLWFFSLGAMLIIGIIVWIIFIQTRRIRRRAELNETISNLKSRALTAQLKPHMVFNVLNSIQGMVSESRVEESNIFISRFSKYLRNTLKYSKQTNCSVEDEIKMTWSYIELEKLRFEDTVEFIMSVELNHLGYSVPSLITQPLIENAIKHGGFPICQSVKQIQIIYREDDEFLIISVSDNGVGLSEDCKWGDGLSITNERLTVMSPQNRLEVSSFKKPTTFQIKIKK